MFKNSKAQAGITLIELMVGIAIGLLTITVGLGSLMISRGVSGTVSEATNLQQQAAHAFRIIGQQARQAGSIELNLDPDLSLTGGGTSPALTPVAFDPPDITGVRPPFNRSISTIKGNDSPSGSEYALTLGYQNTQETLTAASGTKISEQLRDCLSANQGPASMPVLISQFTLRDSKDVAHNSKELVCANSLGIPQAVIQNVSDMTIRYIVQDTTIPTSPRFQYATAAVAAASNGIRLGWADVYAIEVCLEMVGSEAIDTAGATYTKCDGTTASRGNKLRMVFRNTFQIRSQGQPQPA